MNNKTQLLCTFTRKNKLEETIEEILKTYTIAFGRIYILENLDNKRELICTYNVNFDPSGEALRSTISIHRKKQTNTLYTINALNHVVSLLNDGKVDPHYEVDWSKFQNTLLVTDENGLKKIQTKIFDIREV
jgi:hypothetical protein